MVRRESDSPTEKEKQGNLGNKADWVTSERTTGGVMDEFEELVDQYYQPLYRFGFSLSKNPDRAADLVQQTFVIWAQKGHQLKDRSKAKTWLFTTLYREHLGLARRSRRHPETELTEAEHELPREEEDSGRKMDAQRVLSLLGQLDEVFRAPLTLFYLQQHSYKEIARILDVPIGTVMSRISRGKDLLRKKMTKEPASAPTRIVEFQREPKKKNNG
jgi:RNA polymerase sigma-70 factor (ECF subfamily)